MKTRYLGLALLALLACAGCDDYDHSPDHTPPTGQGTLVIDNHTYRDLLLYVDGTLVVRVGDGDMQYFDYLPGTYRVILDEDDGSRSVRADVDILENRLTVVEVDDGITSQGEFPSVIYFD